MSSELLPYYERELLFIRKMASEFAERYPERASALRLTHNGCEDPHVERMIEAFALIAGRIQRKIDEEFPEITQALLELLYPHLLRQVPSMAIAQFEVDPEQSKSSTGQVVPRGAMAYSEPIGGVQCRFRTAYPVRLFPIGIASAGFSRAADLPGGVSSATAQHAIRIELQSQGTAKFPSLKIRDLRFHIAGDPQAAHWLYELLFNNVSHVLLRFQDKGGRWSSTTLGPDSILEVGFGREEAVLPYAKTSFQGYRLLQEYFCFPQKFLFFDLTQVDRLASAALTDRFEIVILLDEFQRAERATLLESAVGRDTFQLGCTPVVNLFDHCAEPIRLSHTRTEYPIIPDVHAPLGMEVYSVNRVTSVAPYSEEPKEYRPFYSLRHGEDGARAEAFWFATRRPSERVGDTGTDVYLSLVDRNFKPSLPATESLTTQITCSNRNLPERLALSGRWGELDLESSAIVRTRIVRGPTRAIRPPLRKALQWRLISHLSLNHLSLVEGGAEALREILRLYDTASNPSGTRQIAGLVSLSSSRKMARLESEHGFVFCQGVAIDTEFDEEQFAGGGAFLLASILERFFGLYSAVNSFTQLRVTTRQRKGVVWAWPPRTGEQIVA
jgi:type VI secretion system protein ImpG